MNRSVVITGLGVICSQAMSAAELFGRLEQGQSSIRNHPRFAGYGLKNPACAYIDASVWEGLEAEQGDASLGPQARLALYAAQQAITESGLELKSIRRKGLFVASNKHTFSEHQLLAMQRHGKSNGTHLDLDAYIRHGGHASDSFFHKRQDTAALALGRRFGFEEIVSTHGDACAAGSIAIGNGFRHIRHGELDVALVGAAETMCNYVPMIAFGALGALSPDPHDAPEQLSRPFDRHRNGFVMGEGGAFLVLESREHAEGRGASILGSVVGFAKQSEAHRITASPSDGSQYARCMQAALEDAGLTARDIDHINAHGTSTPQNDGCEAAAIKQLFGKQAAGLPVTSNKSALGHSLAASGAIEAVLSTLSLHRQTLLPTLNYQEPDLATEGLQVVQKARPCAMEYVLSNSFGFGGENCALVLRRS